MYQKIKNNKIRDISSVAYTSMIIIAGVNILLILLAPEIVRVFAPSEYYDAIWVMPPVAMSVFFMYIYDLFAKFAFYYEETGYIMLASVVGAALNVLLNWIFISKYGYYAAGYTTLFCYAVYAVAHYALMRVVCKKYIGEVKVYDMHILLGITGGFLALGFVGLGLYHCMILRYCFIVGVCIIVGLKRKALSESMNEILKIKL